MITDNMILKLNSAMTEYDITNIIAQEILKKETMLQEVLLRKMMVLNTEEQDIYN